MTPSDHDQSTPSSNGDGRPPPPTFRELMQSVGAAMLGVQTEAARRRDFTRGRPSQYILLGLLATGLFAATLYGIVRLILHFAGL